MANTPQRQIKELSDFIKKGGHTVQRCAKCDHDITFMTKYRHKDGWYCCECQILTKGV